MAGSDTRIQFQFRTPCASSGRDAIRPTTLQLQSAKALAILTVVGALAASLSGCASAGSTTTSHSAPTATPAPTSLRMNPIGDGLFCATQFAWSPDSTLLAVVGNGVNCSGAASGRTPGLILIYDRSGKLRQKLQPDTAVLAQPAIAQKVAANSAAGGTIDTLTYDNLTWTPDSQALLMTFDLELQANPSEGSVTGAQGVQRLGVTDPSRTKVWLDANTSHVTAAIERWDLTTGASSFVPDPAKAPTYQWGSDGMLAPGGATSGQTVGTPDGGRTFTVWQPGSLLFATKSDKATENTTVLTQDIAWLSYTSPLSPDGRYYYPTLICVGSVVPPSTQRAAANEPVLQPHDRALVTLAQQMMRSSSPSQNTHILIAWRPDGHYLAALTPDAGASNPAAFSISIYDTASGKLVKQVTPDFTGLHAGPAGNVALQWSPDGSRLLLVDNIYGALTVWGPGALPA